MSEKILLYVDSSEFSNKTVQWTLRLAKELQARVIALYVLKQSKQKSEKIEEAAWVRLYEIEDDAFSASVKISLLLDEGKPLKKIVECAQSYEVDLIILSAESKGIDFKQLVKFSPQNVGVIIVK